MRIVSGTHKGRSFPVSKSFKSRPTTDIAKESLFNILTNTYNFSDLKVLDLFAGTGSISFEFASRNALEVIAVEKSYPLFKHLIKTSNDLGFDNIRFIKKDVFSFLRNNEERADIIFADPPFDHPLIDSLPSLILDGRWLNPGGCLIMEHPNEYKFDSRPEFDMSKAYGSVNFSFFFVD